MRGKHESGGNGGVNLGQVEVKLVKAVMLGNRAAMVKFSIRCCDQRFNHSFRCDYVMLPLFVYVCLAPWVLNGGIGIVSAEL